MPPRATDSTWAVYTFVGDKQLEVGGKKDPQTITFANTGAIKTPATPIQYDTFIPLSGAAAQNLTLNLGNSTQLSSAFAVNSKSQDGVPVGQLAGVTVTSEGLIQASFSNGDIVPLGKVALAKFSTPTGLRQIGNSYWSATGLSGTATMGSAAADGFGSLMSGQIEGSNVDITEETGQPDRRAAQLPGELEGARYREPGLADHHPDPRLNESVGTRER